MPEIAPEELVSKRRRVRQFAFALVGVIFVTSISFLGIDIQKKFSLLNKANSDNVQWILSQTEIDITNLATSSQIALLKDPPPLNDVRLKYDILYSRVEALTHRMGQIETQESSGISANLARLTQFISSNLALIDSPDEIFSENLGKFASEAEAARIATRGIALAGLQEFAFESEKRRASLIATISRIVALTTFLIFSLIIAIIYLGRMNRTIEDSALAQKRIGDRLESVISTSLDAIVVSDSEGQILEFNHAAERLFGDERSKALGTRIEDLIVSDPELATPGTCWKDFLSEVVSQVDEKNLLTLEAKKRDGGSVPIELALTTDQNADGDIYICFMQDISNRLQAEKALKDSRDKAIAGERSKAEMLAVMSHEMRTPLNGMLGTLELFDYKSLTVQQRKHLSILSKSANLLLGHVNDVLDVSRLDAGKMSVHKRPFDMIELLHEVVEAQTGRAMANGTKISITPPNPDLHDTYSDPERLRQILLNLVGNAIKFTENGSITLEMDCCDGVNLVEIRVIDTGIGISQSDVDRIFQDFETIDTAYNRKNTGTGLGLGIAQRITDALGGEIGVESEPGEGSVFWIRVPMAPPTLETSSVKHTDKRTSNSSKTDTEVTSLNVLIVEDNLVNRMILREMLEREGHSVFEATNGLEGVESVHQNDFDLVLMDISMPVMDGVDATKAIKKLPSPACDVPIVATTAHALTSEIESFLAAGMSESLVKPLSRKKLRDMIDRVVVGVTPADTPKNTTPELDLVDEKLIDELEEDLGQDVLLPAFAQLKTDVAIFFEDVTEESAELKSRLHRLGGAAGIFGATRFHQMIKSLEEDVSTAPSDSICTRLKELQSCWDTTLQAFEQLDLFQQ